MKGAQRVGKLTIAVLGTPTVYHAGQLLTFPTRKALALLIYLAVQGGVHSRDKISAFFWPDSAPDQGRTALRTTLVQLRNTLDEGSASSKSSLANFSHSQTSHLQTDRDALQVNVDSDIELDVQTLQAALQVQRELSLISAASFAVQQERPRRAIDQLKAAGLLYRGDFLEGFSLSDAPAFDDWSSLQRELWHHKGMLIFESLSQAQFEGGDVAGAIESTLHWLALDALNEVAHRRMIQLQLAIGDRVAAWQAFESCRAILGRELSVAPEPETMALAKHIRVTPVSPRQERARQESPSPALAEMPLVGRIIEHRALVTAYRLTLRGQLQIVTVEGEPGIGKTRLVKQFLAWATTQGAAILQGSAYETGEQLPYHPLIAALRQGLEDAQELETLLPPIWWAELSRLLPELAERMAGIPIPLLVNDTEARGRLFEAVAQFGRALTRSAPLILFIDDLQWADVASLDLLRYLCGRWRDGPILLILAVRTEDLTTPKIAVSGETRTLADWLESLQQAGAMQRLTLGLLTLDDTQQLLQALTKANPALPATPEWVEQLSRHLFVETSGQPFFITQTLRTFNERGQWERAGEGWGIEPRMTAKERADSQPLEPSIRALIHARLSRSGANGLALCTAGAVLGHPFDFNLLHQIAGVGENDGLAALETLLSRGLMREVNGRYMFTHDKIREVAYSELSQARRRVFHRRALEALEAQAAAPSLLASHALAAGQNERAVRYSITAGDAALRLFAVRSAIVHYQQARALLGHKMDGPVDGDTVVVNIEADHEEHLDLQLGYAYQLASDWENASICYEAACHTAHTAEHPPVECIALNRLATLAAQFLFDGAKAIGLLNEALEIAQKNHDLLGLAETEWNLAQTNFFAWHLPQALIHGQQSLALARQAHQPHLIARSLNVIAYIGLVTGAPVEEVVSQAQEARHLYVELGNRALEADCLWVIASAWVHTGYPQRCIAAGREGIAISREIENAWGFANNAYNLALGLLECGEYTEALEIAQSGVAQARSGHPPTLVFNLLVLGEIYRALGAVELALSAHQEAGAVAAKLRQPFVSEWVAADLCADYALAGEWTQAYECARQALSLRTYQWAYPGFTRWHETEAMLHEDNSQDAAQDVYKFGEQLHHFGEVQRYRVMHLRAAAVLAEWQGETAEAIAYLRQALMQAEAIGLPGEIWRIEVALGKLLWATGEADAAGDALRHARAIVHGLADQMSDEMLRGSLLQAAAQDQ